MYVEDLKTLSGIGKALWIHPSDSEQSTLETVAAVSLLNLNSERTLEKAATALLEKAQRQGVTLNSEMNSAALGEKFFRLAPRERGLLASLHIGHWSYERISRILKISSQEVEELAWKTRLELSGVQNYPSSPVPLGKHCPAYDPRRPWTQRFLDDELTTVRERLFLQQHLMACSACRRTWDRCREVYFKTDRQVLKMAGNSDFVQSLSQVLNQSPVRVLGLKESFKRSFRRFLRRWDVGVILLWTVIWILLKFFYS